MKTPSVIRKSLGQYYARKRPVRFKFIGTLAAVSVGARDGIIGKTVLIRDVKMASQTPWVYVADHVWLMMPGEFTVPKHLPKDTEVTFTGIVRRYARRDGKENYGIGEIEKFEILGPVL